MVHALTEYAPDASYHGSMRRAHSSLGAETAWLLIFFAIFGITAWLLLKFVVPHHFNDRIAIVIAAIVSGAVMIALRAWFSRG